MANLIENKKAFFNYEIKDKYESGIELLGHEVKALKSGRGNLSGSYVTIRGLEAFIIGLEIPEYQAKNTPENYDPKRNRKLLISKKDLRKLSEMENQNGLTLIPISLYNKGRFIKLEFALAKGKKKADKRESIKKRESDREIHRTLKNQR